ncbi:serine O-acetyltransferase [Fibrobacter sp. UWB16]|uniref:serine O-acetyltransferase EpsC n=1 Tax=Fibrobacter sp. UWB16 TaxID=1945874 RepID=UPI000BDC0868|nr:serine O-acetyltransferase EpsC [Fibrobacter sp. UWB16]SOD11434.1 serine O-acetyltransferase [Fibrobacter sp. UWB16]
MHELIQESEVEKAVQIIFDDYNRGKHIDNIDIYNRPDQAEIQTILQNLIRVVYPGHFRDRSHKIYNPKNSFAVLIEDTFYHLHKQVAIALDYCKLRGSMTSDERKIESYRICKEFFAKIPQIREFLETDLHAAFDGDPAAGCLDEIILAYPGLMATTIYRIAHELYLLHVPVLPRLMTEYAHSKTGIDIHPGATIGKYFFIDHGTGIVIGETAVIGKNVKIYQGVTLGALSTRGGQKLSGKKRHPTIQDNVTIYAGASILGGDTIVGENAIIGGNAFITRSIEANTRVSLKNLEMDYVSTTNSKHKTEELQQSDEWYYII